MSAEKCAVPNCNNPTTTGIPFPKQSELQIKWLESLEIPDFVPTPTSFVCLDHFGDGDLLGHVTDISLENVLEELPIPTPNNGTTPIKSEENEENTPLCRLCMSQNDLGSIFDKFDKNITICEAVMQCIPPIKITKDDYLSKLICNKCLEMIKLFHKFRVSCLDKNTKQKELLLKKSQKRKLQDISSSDNIKRICPDLQNSEIDRKFDQVEAELMRALEGKLTDEMKSADNIIIEVRSDDESDQETKCTNVVKVGNNELKLPKGIKVSVNQTKIGDGQMFHGMNNSEFCLVDNYLFEYRLCKGNIRHLKCLMAKCKATAQQTIIAPRIFDDKISVKSPHNHPPPNEDEKKKQIFFHLIRRKMQSDKTLNFRSVYEEFCEKDPELRKLVPLKTVINQICCQQMSFKSPMIQSFEQFFNLIEDDQFQKLHFTHLNKQFYQDRFAADDGSKAVVFANCDTIEQISDSKIMYVDASFKIDTKENFQYHLVTTLVWVSDSYYPIMFALVNEKSQEIYKIIFEYLHNTLAPKLRPEEIVTDYEATLYYSLGETYSESHIGGSVFYYTQNLYKKICSLNLSRELETNSCFRNIYHMILMLPLLPVNTISDGLNNIELQAAEMSQTELTNPIFEYVKSEWMNKVTPDLFCVHRLENRINENVIAPFKKLRDFLMLSKGKIQKQQINIISVVEKLIELEGFLQSVYSAPSKRSFTRDLSISQKKNVIRAWQYIENHPKININNFFTKVLGYIKCMENQLWIWGFYRYTGNVDDELIKAANFCIVNANDDEDFDHNYEQNSEYVDYVYPDNEVVMDVVIDQKDGFLIKDVNEAQRTREKNQHFSNDYIN